MRIDLHVHSSASDGTTSPAGVMAEAARAGLDVVALTDHDTTAGWDAAAAALPPRLTLVPGAEVSCRWFPPGPPDAPPISLHLLAYLFDPAEPAFAAERARVRRSRHTRAARMVELLRADGVPVSWDAVRAEAADAPVGRPHVARALVAAGVVADVPGAFGPEWLGDRYRVPKADTEVFTALRLVHGAGGVAVFAHPKAWARGPVVPDAMIADLAAAGLDGLEVDHPDHDPVARATLRSLAADLGLLVTGSSDYHGTGKPVRLGEHATTSRDTYERIVAAASGGAPVTG